MHKAKDPVTGQLGLFPTVTWIPQLPREMNPKVVSLLARLLRQYAERETSVAKDLEGCHE